MHDATRIIAKTMFTLRRTDAPMIGVFTYGRVQASAACARPRGGVLRWLDRA